MKSFSDFLTEEKWITIKPGGPKSKGIHVEIDDEGNVTKGLGNKFKGDHISDIKPENKKSKVSLTKNKAHEVAQPVFTKGKEQELKNALNSYTGSTFKRINKALRGIEKSSLYVDGLIQRIDEVFDNSRVKDDIIVYRGFNSNRMADVKEGDEILDNAFTSTSTDSMKAKSFSKQGENLKTVMKILVPKGSKAISVKDYSKYQSENEIVLNRKSKFKITSVKKTKTSMTIEAELVQED